MRAKLPTWSRRRSVFAGIDLNGVSVSRNREDTDQIYSGAPYVSQDSGRVGSTVCSRCAFPSCDGTLLWPSAGCKPVGQSAENDRCTSWSPSDQVQVSILPSKKAYSDPVSPDLWRGRRGSNPRTLPWQDTTISSFNDLQHPGDCLSMRKWSKTASTAGGAVG